MIVENNKYFKLNFVIEVLQAFLRHHILRSSIATSYSITLILNLIHATKWN